MFYNVKCFPSDISFYKGDFILVHDGWDDWFEFETKFNLFYIFDDEINKDLIVSNEKWLHLGTVKIGMQQMNDIRVPSIPDSFEKLDKTFFSLGQNEDYYESIKSLGDEKREYVLSALRDVAFDLTIYRSCKTLRVMSISLMRSVSEFQIINQFNRIANGKIKQTEFEFFYTYPTQHLEDVTQIDFNVVPNSFPPTNIHVIVGRNSVGKTFLIKNMINSIYEPDDVKFGRIRSKNEKTGYLVSSSRKYQVFANIVCVSFSPFDDYSDIRELLKLKKKVPFSYIGLNEDEKGIDSIYQELYESFLSSLQLCKEDKQKTKLLKNAIEILETDPIFERSNIDDLLENYDDEDEFKEKAKRLFTKLSSGHKMIILIITELVSKLVEKSLVILDEPENHLHPPLLSAFIQSLSFLLREKNGVALIATHSPVILQEVPQSCIWKISRNGYEVSADRLSVESYGSNIGMLTREVFGLEVRKSGFQKIIDDKVNEGKSYQQIIGEFNCQLGDEAKALLNTLIAIRDNRDK